VRMVREKGPWRELIKGPCWLHECSLPNEALLVGSGRGRVDP
jgi:hypothetical protein